MIAAGRKTSNPRIFAIVEELKDGFCIMQLDGEFIYMNRSASAMFGFEVNQYGQNFFNDVIRDRKHVNFIKTTLNKQDYIQDYELNVYTASDNKFPVLISINEIKDPGEKRHGYSILIKDMTYIKKVQQQLLQAQKMESIGMLASGIAHEFNNILTGIIPNAELIKMTTKKGEANFNRAQSIKNSALRAADIVRKLLSFARNDKKEPTQATDFKETALETIDIISKLFERQIDIEINFPPDLYYVEVDSTRLQQIIMNLSINAKDALDEGGKIIFSAENVDIPFGEERDDDLMAGKYIRFSIADNGHGIDPKQMPHIFDPFFTTKEPGKGTGLGLSIIYGIINSLNGKIEVQSELNKGTTFYVTLPATDVIENDSNSDIQLEPAKTDATILVVDDEQMILEMARDMLTSLGYGVMQASNGQEGIECYKKNSDKIDIVLLDLIMPKMNGVVCVEKMKEINPDVNIIITSGIGDLSKKKEIEKLSIRAFLEKPFSLKAMSDTINQILQD